MAGVRYAGGVADQVAPDPPQLSRDADGIYLRLSAQRALLGAIARSVRRVAVGYGHGQTVIFAVAMDHGTDVEQEALDVAAAEVIADYSAGWTIDVRFTDGSEPDLRSTASSWVVYQRLDPE